MSHLHLVRLQPSAQSSERARPPRLVSADPLTELVSASQSGHSSHIEDVWPTPLALLYAQLHEQRHCTRRVETARTLWTLINALARTWTLLAVSGLSRDPSLLAGWRARRAVLDNMNATRAWIRLAVSELPRWTGLNDEVMRGVMSHWIDRGGPGELAQVVERAFGWCDEHMHELPLSTGSCPLDGGLSQQVHALLDTMNRHADAWDDAVLVTDSGVQFVGASALNGSHGDSPSVPAGLNTQAVYLCRRTHESIRIPLSPWFRVATAGPSNALSLLLFSRVVGSVGSRLDYYVRASDLQPFGPLAHAKQISAPHRSSSGPKSSSITPSQLEDDPDEMPSSGQWTAQRLARVLTSTTTGGYDETPDPSALGPVLNLAAVVRGAYEVLQAQRQGLGTYGPGAGLSLQDIADLTGELLDSAGFARTLVTAKVLGLVDFAEGLSLVPGPALTEPSSDAHALADTSTWAPSLLSELLPHDGAMLGSPVPTDSRRCWAMRHLVGLLLMSAHQTRDFALMQDTSTYELLLDAAGSKEYSLAASEDDMFERWVSGKMEFVRSHLWLLHHVRQYTALCRLNYRIDGDESLLVERSKSLAALSRNVRSTGATVRGWNVMEEAISLIRDLHRSALEAPKMTWKRHNDVDWRRSLGRLSREQLADELVHERTGEIQADIYRTGEAAEPGKNREQLAYGASEAFMTHATDCWLHDDLEGALGEVRQVQHLAKSFLDRSVKYPRAAWQAVWLLARASEGRISHALGRTIQAAKLLDETLNVYDSSGSDGAWKGYQELAPVTAILDRAGVHAELGQLDEAEERLSQAVRLAKPVMNGRSDDPQGQLAGALLQRAYQQRSWVRHAAARHVAALLDEDRADAIDAPPLHARVLTTMPVTSNQWSEWLESERAHRRLMLILNWRTEAALLLQALTLIDEKLRNEKRRRTLPDAERVRASLLEALQTMQWGEQPSSSSDQMVPPKSPEQLLQLTTNAHLFKDKIRRARRWLLRLGVSWGVPFRPVPSFRKEPWTFLESKARTAWYRGANRARAGDMTASLRAWRESLDAWSELAQLHPSRLGDGRVRTTLRCLRGYAVAIAATGHPLSQQQIANEVWKATRNRGVSPSLYALMFSRIPDHDDEAGEDDPRSTARLPR